MRSIKSEGDSIDEAIETGLRTLEVPRDRVEVEILNDASRGLLGFGGKKARVRVTVRAPLRISPDVPRGTSTPTPPPAEPRAASIPSQRVPPVPPRARTEEPKPAPREPAQTPPPAERPASRSAVPIEFEARCRSLLTDLLAHVGVSCMVRSRTGAEPGSLVLEVVGDSSGILIGRRGQTLDALEYLLNRIVGRHEDATGTRVMIDVEHYRERRREYLEGLAQRLAEKAKQTGRVVTLNPMSPRDRRIVHLALQADPAITTRSQGEGYLRKILILPAERVQPGRPRPNGSPIS